MAPRNSVTSDPGQESLEPEGEEFDAHPKMASHGDVINGALPVSEPCTMVEVAKDDLDHSQVLAASEEEHRTYDTSWMSI